jgi:hypothetical protein
MDKTLADYIKRTQEDLDKVKVWTNRNVWNDPALAKQDYLVYPEKQSIDSDEKINPYGEH